MGPQTAADARATAALPRSPASAARRRGRSQRAAAALAASALVLGLLPPLSSPAAAADPTGVPIWAEQGDQTTRIDVAGTDHLVHVYEDGGASSFEVPAGVDVIDHLVVGGGGAGGARGGGGGAGGVIEGSRAVGAGQAWRHGEDVTVAVGAGGLAPSSETEKDGVAGQSGGNSLLGSLTAVGGGHGGNDDDGRGGAAGGSGGGGGHRGGAVTSGGDGTAEQGHDGGGNGGAFGSPWPAGGGGGAGEGETGGPGSKTGVETRAGDGGNGVTSQITGSAVVYGGGGGGQVLYDLDADGDEVAAFDGDTTAGSGGDGGGGHGGNPCGVTAGANGRGGGGGGGDTRRSTYALDLCPDAGSDGPQPGGPQPGGSGVVILRYAVDGLVSVSGVTVEDAAVTVGQDTTVTVAVVDIDSSPAGGVEVTLDAGHGASPDAVTTDADGQATFSVTHDIAETITYTATVDGVAMGTAEVTYSEAPAWQPPAPQDQGAFTISSYAGSEIGQTASRWWRGYVFTVAEETTVTHLVGSGTRWSTVGLFAAEVTGSGDTAGYSAEIQDQQAWDGASANPDELDALALGWVLIEGDVTDQPMALHAPVTLSPGTQYLLAQSAAKEDGTFGEEHNRYVYGIDRDDLLGHPRIGDVWIPEGDRSLRWEGSNAEAIAGAHTDSDELMPLVGFLYDSDAAAPVVTTTDPATTPFAGTLTATGGSGTTVCLDVGESEAEYERRCVDAVDADATAGEVTVDFALGRDDLAGFDGVTLSYRAAGINEVGVALGDWAAAHHTAGTLTVETRAASLAPDTPATAVDAAGTVTDDGGVAHSERGFVYAVVDADEPSYDDHAGRVESGTGVGDFTARIDDLAPNTTYAVRAYAHNAEGTVYGETLQVSTERQPLTLPGVTVEDRAYDGTTDATVTGYQLTGTIEAYGDVQVDLDAVFSDADVGERTAEVTDAVLTGGDAERYELILDPAPTTTATIRAAEATLSFVGGLAWPAFAEGEQATTAPIVAVDPATDAADGQDHLAARITLAYGRDEAATATPPSQEGSYRVTARLDHPNYAAQAVHSTVVVIPPLEDDEDAPVIGPVPDHDEDGELQTPTREPSTATVTEDGGDVGEVTVTGSQGAPLVVAPTGGGFRVALDARERSGGPPTGVDAEGRLRLTGGRFLHVSGEGFRGGSRVEVWLFSEPRFLGTASVDANGEFDAEFSVPADPGPGEHTVQLSGYRADGALRTISVGLLVDPAPDAGPTPSPDEPQPAPAPEPAPVLDPDAQVAAWLEEALGGLSDVAAGDTSAEGIALTVWADIAVGYADGSFRPHQPITRGQVASLLASALELTAEGPAPFGDVPEGSTHAAAIAAIAAADIAVGHADGSFRPHQPITRGQVASLLASAFELTAEGPAPFGDVSGGSTHAAAIAAIAAADIAVGYADGSFRHHQPITRGQVASLLANALDLEGAILDAAIADAG